MIKNMPLLGIIFVYGVLLVACGEANTSTPGSGNFKAEVTGIIKDKVSGRGVITYLPPQEGSFGLRPGYFFVADDTGVRELCITFTIPSDTQPGIYQLVSAHPMSSGKKFEVRVDHVVGDETKVFQHNTEGTITIKAFPEDGVNLAGQHIMGSFDFTTRDREGRQVSGEGSFDFYGKDRRSKALR